MCIAIYSTTCCYKTDLLPCTLCFPVSHFSLPLPYDMKGVRESEDMRRPFYFSCVCVQLMFIIIFCSHIFYFISSFFLSYYNITAPTPTQNNIRHSHTKYVYTLFTRGSIFINIALHVFVYSRILYSRMHVQYTQTLMLCGCEKSLICHLDIFY